MFKIQGDRELIGINLEGNGEEIQYKFSITSGAPPQRSVPLRWLFFEFCNFSFSLVYILIIRYICMIALVSLFKIPYSQY
jgi:hypothetical protein